MTANLEYGKTIRNGLKALLNLILAEISDAVGALFIQLTLNQDRY